MLICNLLSYATRTVNVFHQAWFPFRPQRVNNIPQNVSKDSQRTKMGKRKGWKEVRAHSVILRYNWAQFFPADSVRMSSPSLQFERQGRTEHQWNRFQRSFDARPVQNKPENRRGENVIFLCFRKQKNPDNSDGQRKNRGGGGRGYVSRYQSEESPEWWTVFELRAVKNYQGQ